MSRLASRLATATRGLAVGAAATAVDLAVLAVLVHALDVDPRLAGPASLMVGAAVQLVGTKLVTFRDRSRAWARQATGFGVIEALALALNAAGFDLLTTRLGVGPLPARVAVSALVWCAVSLPLWSLVFRPARAAAPAHRGVP